MGASKDQPAAKLRDIGPCTGFPHFSIRPSTVLFRPGSPAGKPSSSSTLKSHPAPPRGLSQLHLLLELSLTPPAPPEPCGPSL